MVEQFGPQSHADSTRLFDQFSLNLLQALENNGSGPPPAAQTDNAGQSAGSGSNSVVPWRFHLPGYPPAVSAPAPVTDSTGTWPVKDGVLEISYADLTRLRGLPATREPYTTLRIDYLPPGVELLNWADQQGYYFFFKGGDQSVNYYIPGYLKEIDLNGQRFDVDRSRLAVSEYALAQASGAGSTNPFATLSTASRTDAITYFQRMSRVSAQTLGWEENVLRQGVQSSSNPYFGIYLADVLTMEALKPLVQGMVAGQVTPQEKQAILDKLDEAQTQLQRAANTSYGPLYQMNHFPPGNVSMPLAPGAFFYTPPSGVAYNPYYSFWGGAWDQASRRLVALQFIRGLVSTDAFQLFQLPPG